MYPAAELARLENRKAMLRQRIASTRVDCIALAAEAAKPLELFDSLRERWRRIAPFAKFAAVPIGMLLGRRLFGAASPRRGGGWSRLIPVVLGLVQLLRARRSG